MNWCLASELPFSEHHCSLSYQYELALLSSLAEHLSLCSPCNTAAQEGRCQPAFGMIKCLIIIMIVTMKIGIIGLSQWFESHEKQSYFKWWVHLFLSLNKYSLLYGSFPFCYRYLVSGTISNHETLICSTYVSMWFIYCMNVFCNISFLRLEVDWNSQTYNSEICIWLTKDWWGNFRPSIYRLSKTRFVCLFLWRGRY